MMHTGFKEGWRCFKAKVPYTAEGMGWKPGFILTQAVTLLLCDECVGKIGQKSTSDFPPSSS